jgi:hypothetical protein
MEVREYFAPAFSTGKSLRTACLCRRPASELLIETKPACQVVALAKAEELHLLGAKRKRNASRTKSFLPVDRPGLIGVRLFFHLSFGVILKTSFPSCSKYSATKEPSFSPY